MVSATEGNGAKLLPEIEQRGINELAFKKQLAIFPPRNSLLFASNTNFLVWEMQSKTMDNCGDASLIEPYTTAVFSNVTFIGPLGRDANFVNNESYITGGSFNPNNGSALGKFQSAMQIRRSSRLNCFNSVAVGYPVGLIIDGEKGNTVEMAKAGNIKLENIWFAGMTVVGSDANKVYDDVLYDAVNKQIIDAGQESYSSTFFKTQKGNKVLTDVNELKFKDGRNIGVNYMPDADSPVLTAASFNDALLSSGFETVEYIGAFGTDDNWLDGWTNFDPNNTDY